MYRRSTREVNLSALPKPVGDALAEHAAAHQLELGSGRAWITHSENPPANGFFGKLLGRRANPIDPDAAHDTALVLHATHLLIVNSGEKRGQVAMSLPLAQASLTLGSALAAKFGLASATDGITISGFPGTVGSPGTYFVGLGADAAGAECSRAVEAAILAAKNPR